MRPTLVLIALLICGCGEAPAPAPPTDHAGGTSVRYAPETFRADLERLIAGRRYKDTVALVKAADVDRQLAADKGGYMAIGVDMIGLPGVYPQVEYGRSRDWYVPGTQDAIEDQEWQSVASEFAERYNRRRHSIEGTPR